MTFEGSCINTQRLLRGYRDFWGEYNPLAIARLDKLCNLDCFVPRFFHAPRNAAESMAGNSYLTYNLKIPPGSWIWCFDSLTVSNMVLQITDIGLNHKWFSSPVPSNLLQSSATADGPRPNYFPAPYPVVDPGVFVVEIWNTSPDTNRCQVTLAAVVPKDACV